LNLSKKRDSLEHLSLHLGKTLIFFASSKPGFASNESQTYSPTWWFNGDLPCYNINKHHLKPTKIPETGDLKNIPPTVPFFFFGCCLNPVPPSRGPRTEQKTSGLGFSTNAGRLMKIKITQLKRKII